MEKYGVITFQQGMQSQKGVEFSPAAERTKHRSLRRLYQARKYKLWATLKILIENGFCPLAIDELDNWRKYEECVGRIFPSKNTAFNNWIKLDFDGDGKPGYTSLNALRAELASEKQGFTQEKNKFKLGRALYHIAQHRGFKSSKKVKMMI